MAQALPEIQRPTQRKASTRKFLLFTGVAILVVAGVAIASVTGTGKTMRSLFASSDTGTITYTVKRAKLPVTIKEKGNLESSSNEDVFNEVEGQVMIIMILPEGTHVTKGQLVCELDSSALRDNLTNQIITTKGAESNYLNANLTRQVAEIAVREYVEGVYKQDMATAKGEEALAESDKKRAEDRVVWANHMLEKNYISLAQQISEHLALQRAVFALEQAQTKKKVLEDYTYEKTVMELKSEVEKAKADELAKQATLGLEKQKEDKLRKQIEKCKLIAPADGLVVYANDPNRFGGNAQPQIEDGATVREHQKIFSLPDISKMRVNTKVHESMVNFVSKGLRAKIRVDAFPTDLLTGTVDSVNPLPDPNSFFSSDIKVYTTQVGIDNGPAALRPGMTAQVEILVTELENVLSVPVEASLPFRGKFHLYVMTPDGPKRREVKLGTANDQFVEVKEGITPGEQIVMNPTSLMTEEEKREVFGTSGSGDDKEKDWSKIAAKKVGGPDGKAGLAGPDGKGGPDAAKAKAKGKWAGGAGKKGGRGGGGFDPAMKERFMNASPEEKQQMIEQFKAANPGFVPGGGGGGGGPGPQGGGGAPQGGQGQ